MIKKCEYIISLLEETFPFIFYLINKRKIWNKINSSEKFKELDQYSKLPEEVLIKRIKEEHKRAIDIDEKTTKYITSLSLFLSFLSGGLGLIYNSYYTGGQSYFILLCFLIAAILMLIAGLISLSSLKTLPLYGFGTTHEIKLLDKQNQEYLPNSLIKQEKVNSCRHIANEATYQCLRNGIFILIFAILLICIFSKSQKSKSDINPVKQTLNTK